MTKATESVIAAALHLNPKQRARVAVEILASLDGPADPDAAAAWEKEIQRRVDTIEAGTAKLESWETAKRRIAADILGR
jgi:hypothetical protein